MRDAAGGPDSRPTMTDTSIQEINGKGPRKRKKSLELICDTEGKCEASEVAAAAEPAGGDVGGAAERVQLLHWRDMPKHLQFNPYVLTGYRPLQSWGGCVRSLFYFHNETINILTHGVSLVYILAVMPGLLPWGGGGGGGGAWFLSLCHLLGALAPWLGSFLYHLFMNHTSGASLYHRLLQLDMLGIWVSQSIGAIPMVTATVYCAPAPLRYSALAVYCLGSLLGLYKVRRRGDARVVAVGASSVLRGAVLHAAAAGRRPRSAARRRRPARHTTRLLTGRGVTRRRRDRRAAHPGEVVPGRCRPLPQLAQHHARSRRARRVLHAPGDDARHSLDVARGLPRAATPALTPAAAPRIVLLTTVHKYTRDTTHDTTQLTWQTCRLSY